MLAAVGAFQLLLLYFTYCANDQNAKAAINQAKTLIESLAETRKAASAAVLNAEAANRQAQTLEKTFLITHRPRLRVRNVEIDLSEWRPEKHTESTLHGSIHVVNYGDAYARIEAAQVGFLTGSELPMVPPYEGLEAIELRITQGLGRGLDAGESVTVRFGGDKSYALDYIVRSGHRLFVLGYIKYRTLLPRELAGNEMFYETAFCRRFDPARRMFQIEKDNPDYEHEE
jgi:hypothetical protein